LTYRIFETEGFLADLEKDFQGRQQKIKRKLREYVYQQLMVSPDFGPNIKRLRGFDPPVWRYRIGPYRFFFQIDRQERIVFMIAAEHRSRSYRR